MDIINLPAGLYSAAEKCGDLLGIKKSKVKKLNLYV